jgi:hypothetical protein
MACRIARVAVVAVLVSAAPAAGQRAGAVELGAFARYTNFDNSLRMSNTIGAGGRASVAIRPGLAFEVDLSRTSASPDRAGAGGSITYTPLHARVIATFTTGTRVEALAGGGVVRNSYGGAFKQSDGGLSTVAGLRYRASRRVWMRLGVDLDAMFHPSSGSPFAFYNGNWSLTLGAAASLHGGGGSSQAVGLLR